MLKLFCLFLIGLFLNSASGQNDFPKREMRAVWIATISNIDWPSSKYLSSGEKIKELTDLFDKLKEIGINAVFFQVRPESDALYNSPYEPWSEWLTGKQGRAPEPYFDPLKLAVDEAHKRGMELHAWINPLRVSNAAYHSCSVEHICNIHPDWILKFSNYKMLDPGIPEVREYVAQIVSDIVRRYEVDGVNFDDYFYPYKPAITKEDYKNYQKYKGDYKRISDWRRENINKLIQVVHDSLTASNKKVKFGISPFGIVKNSYAGTAGLSSYSRIYSDPLAWLKDKTIDYIVPQVYWTIGNKSADYKSLVSWWASVVGEQHLYIGQTLTYASDKIQRNIGDELFAQIELNRNYRKIYGSVFFSASTLVENVYTKYSKQIFKYRALVPSFSYRDSLPPMPPKELRVYNSNDGFILKWDKEEKAADGDTAKFYVVYSFDNPDEINFNNPRYITDVIPANTLSYKIFKSKTNGSNYFAVTSLDAFNNESSGDALIRIAANDYVPGKETRKVIKNKPESIKTGYSPSTVTTRYLCPP